MVATAPPIFFGGFDVSGRVCADEDVVHHPAQYRMTAMSAFLLQGQLHQLFGRRRHILKALQEIYHAHKGVDGYRSMTVYLARRGYHYSAATIHKYRNTEMGLCSVVRLKKPGYGQGRPHRIFENGKP